MTELHTVCSDTAGSSSLFFHADLHGFIQPIALQTPLGFSGLAGLQLGSLRREKLIITLYSVYSALGAIRTPQERIMLLRKTF